MGNNPSPPSSPSTPSSPSSPSSTSTFYTTSKSSGNKYISVADATVYLKPGDVISIIRSKLRGLPGAYDFVVYVGDGYCIHLTRNEDDEYCTCPDNVTFTAGNIATVCGRCGTRYKSVVVSESLKTVVNKDEFTVANNLDSKYSPLPEEQIITNAKSLLGPVSFNGFVYNSEHFANWCRYGIAVSLETSHKWPNAKNYKQKITKPFMKLPRQ